ncbi:MAG: threonine--tRNA ligase [Clostridia bacterium]|nr:threonine--tRNA ligase [Clostridia bacterium]
MKVIEMDGRISICEGAEERMVLRHSAAHILAQAVQRLWPGASLAGSAASEKGFFYDFDPGEARISADDLPKIEAEMRVIVKENLPVKLFVLEREAAAGLMRERHEPYRQEQIAELPENARVCFCRQGEFIDRCDGPHIPYTKGLKAFRLTGVSGAYWKNDSANKMLTRIHGVAFPSQDELDEYEHRQAEAAKRDHRIIGREMDLFQLCDEGPGFPFFLPNGMILREVLTDYWRTIHRKNGYREISTPVILHRSLWETSGHWEHYRDTMYSTVIDGEDYCIKPMSCPGGILVYRNRPHSYRDFPLRLAELGLVHRNELKGTLHGLFRVRCFTQDDAHIFMRKEQIADEIEGVIRLIDEVYRTFGFPYTLELSTRPENSMGSDEDWEAAENGLREALERSGKAYTVNEGDGAFYGPKIDFHLSDSLGRTWQCGTIQLDFQLPQNFELTYTDENGQKQRPVMIHRVCFGSIERFIGILTEHYAGKFPVWLAPVQAKVLLVSEKCGQYAEEVCDALRDAGIRCELDKRKEKIGYMIREAQYVERVPYLLIVGERETADGTVSVRCRDNGAGTVMRPDEFVKKIKEECAH